jgi:aspartate/tyrosine/aromatic aminotransferase
MSFFQNIEMMPEDPILSLPIMFKADPSLKKVNLGVGAYQDSEGDQFVLASVRKAEALIASKNGKKEYLPIEGDQNYINESYKLIFGENSSIRTSGLTFGAQTIGGTNALRIGGEFIAQQLSKSIYISDPSWPNHKGIFTKAGLKVESYPYYDTNTNKLDFAKTCESIKLMPPGSAILLQGSCHNPTGLDPSFEQWQELSSLLKKQKILPFFDFAYQGFGKGIEEDAQAIRYFYEQGHEMLIATSYSKNMGLYGERAGFFAIVSSDEKSVKKATSHLKQIIRGNYSTPTLHTARIVSTLLISPEIKALWKEELTSMRERIKEMRIALITGIKSKNAKKDFDFLQNQLGIFSFCGLNSHQVQKLRQEYGIYMPSNGRINVAGLNKKNLPYVIQSILTVL